MSSFWAIMVAIVVGGLLVWAFAGVLSVAFHIAEYVAWPWWRDGSATSWATPAAAGDT